MQALPRGYRSHDARTFKQVSGPAGKHLFLSSLSLLIFSLSQSLLIFAWSSTKIRHASMNQALMVVATKSYSILFDIYPRIICEASHNGCCWGKIPRYHFLQPPGMTQAPGSPIKERSMFPLKGTLWPVPRTDLPSKKWKISDKENLPYLWIWKS